MNCYPGESVPPLQQFHTCVCESTRPPSWTSPCWLPGLLRPVRLFLHPTCPSRSRWCSAASRLCWAQTARGHAGAELCTCVTRRSTPRVARGLRDSLSLSSPHTFSPSIFLISFLPASLCSSPLLSRSPVISAPAVDPTAHAGPRGTRLFPPALVRERGERL